MQYVCKHKTVLGDLYLSEENGFLTGLYLNRELKGEHKQTPLMQEAIKQVDGYLNGKRKSFDLKINPKGTDFQKKIWQQLCQIPYGTAISYKKLAERADSPRGFRAAGGACNKNPILLVIPCHRVIGANGQLVGFGAGLDTKERLLALEQKGLLP